MRTWTALLLIGNLGAVCALLWVTGTIPPSVRSGPAMLLIAHRGDTRAHPENSLSAIIAARDAQVDGVEFDVQTSADGTWWVFHDPTTDRMTGAHALFRLLPDGRIHELRLASTAEGIPLLRDVVKALQSYDGWAYVDIKSTHPDDALTALANVSSLRHIRVIVESVEVAEALKEASPGVDTLALSQAAGQDTSPYVDAWLANQIEITRPDVVSGQHRPVDAFVDLGSGHLDQILDRLSRFGVRAAISGVPR